MVFNPTRALLLWTILASTVGCDSFFELSVLVSDCDTSLPLEGVEATLHFDKGGKRPELAGLTDSKGQVFGHGRCSSKEVPGRTSTSA